MDTREWFDGVLTSAARAAVAEVRLFCRRVVCVVCWQSVIMPFSFLTVIVKVVTCLGVLTRRMVSESTCPRQSLGECVNERLELCYLLVMTVDVARPVTSGLVVSM